MDKDLWNAAKKHTKEANLLGDEDANSENEVENLEVKDEDDIDMSIAYLYLHAITIARNHWREQNATNCLESFVLSHL